tara:strand:+ start:3645 stop:3857 length:213 start_codon:yes stop_codon:yes gene_type:complete
MYQVEQFTLCDGWVNTWHIDDKPHVFKTRDEAILELAEFFSDMTEDYEAGFLSDPVNHKEFRIVEVKNDL